MSMFDEINGNQWWLAKKTDLYQEVFAFVSRLDDRQRYRSHDNLRFARLYGNYEYIGLDAYSYARVEGVVASTNRVTLNIVQNMIDTVVSKITKNKPKAQFLTSGGDFSLQSRAKKLTKFIEGIYSYDEFYDKTAMAFLDACIFGTGCLKIYEDNGQIKTERVFIEEIKIPDVESYYAKPRQMHQVKYIDRDVLKAMFPEKKIVIEQADYVDSDQENNEQLKDMVKVIESWRLPSGEGSGDGRHTICVSSGTLMDLEYTKQYFPFVFFRWGLRPVGFFGQGLAEQLQGLQLEINKLLRTIQVSMHLVSIPKLLVEASSKIVSSHLNNRIGGVIKYAGTPPQYAPLGNVPPDLFSHLDRLFARAYEIAGISQLAAQSLKPAGLDSGKALREFNDLETERFLSVAQRYEKVFIDAAEIIIDMGKDIYEREDEFKIKVKDGKFIETIDWKDVNMDADKYLMEIFPTSALSNTPAARLADIQDLMAGGFIGKEDALKLLDFPDLEATTNMLNADNENLEKLIETMMDKGKYFPPEPYQNLENTIRKVQQAYLMYRVQGASENRLELLRQYMEDCQNLIMKSKERSPSPQELAQQLAQQGAKGAATAALQQQSQGPVGQESAIASGALPLGDAIQQGAQQLGQALAGPVGQQVKEQVSEEVIKRGP